MKKKTGILLTSVAAIAVSTSLVAGSTFALFTSNSKVDITVSTGKVAVSSTVTQITPYTDNEFALVSGDFENGVLTVSDLVPGDGISFKVNVNNDGSAVSVKYRAKIECVGGFTLMNGLELTVGSGDDAVTVKNVKSYATAWDTLKEDDGVDVSLYLPGEAGNEYQDLSTSVRVSVEAVQGNAVITDNQPETVSLPDVYLNPVHTASELSGLFKNAEADETVYVSLEEDVKLNEILNIHNSAYFVGDGESKIITPADENNGRVMNVSGLNGEEVVITFNGVVLEGPQKVTSTYTKGISVYENSADVTLIIENCKMSAIGYTINVGTDNSNLEVIVRDSEIIGWCATQISSANTKMTFENCKLVGVNNRPYSAGGWDNFSTVVIYDMSSGCDLTFNHCVIEANTVNGNRQRFLDIRVGVKLAFNDCTFVKDGIVYSEETKITENFNLFADFLEDAQALVEASDITFNGKKAEFVYSETEYPPK